MSDGARDAMNLIVSIHPFFRSYPREFWKDNKKHFGDVCEECRDEVDVSNVRRRKSRRGSNVVGR